jgi:hypothetical protein
MAVSVVYKAVGPTVALSVANALSAATAVLSQAGGSEMITHASLINSGTTVISIAFGPLTPGTASAAPAAQAVYPVPTFPISGTSTSTATAYILPASMTQPLVVPVPNGSQGFSFQAFGSAAGPSIVYVTPMTSQS